MTRISLRLTCHLLEPDSLILRLLDACISKTPSERAKILELSAELEQAHAAAAQSGDSDVPDNAEDEVDYHYICFARSDKDGHIYELDGDSKGPIDTGIFGPATDLLAPEPLSLIRRYIDREHDNVNFNLMALVHCPA